jgi:hypothetical protein
MMGRDTTTRTGTRTPGVEQCTARTEVHQRTAFPDSEPGYNATGSEMHEGRRQTHVAKNSQTTVRPV